MSENMTRRKQATPAKFPNEYTNGQESTQVTSQPSTDPKEARPSPNVQLIKQGTNFGPFEIVNKSTKLGATNEGNVLNITVTDTTGQNIQLHIQCKHNDHSELMTRLKYSSDIEQSNCTMTIQNNQMRVITSRDVQCESDLLCRYESPCSTSIVAVEDRQLIGTPVLDQRLNKGKQFACDRCCVASFSSRRNLDAHQTYYCRKTEPATDETPLDGAGADADAGDSDTGTDNDILIEPVIAAPTPSPNRSRKRARTASITPNSAAGKLSEGQSSNLPTHAILLPVAYSDSDRVHVIGEPQVVVPVAVPRDTHDQIPIPALHVQSAWLQLAELAQQVVVNGAFKLNICEKPAPFNAALTAHTNGALFKQSASPAGQSDTSSSGSQALQSASINSGAQPITNTNTLDEPLDLSSTSAAGGTSSSGKRKLFRCDCGVSFANQTTLHGHKQFYCKLNSTSQSNISPAELNRCPSASANGHSVSPPDASRASSTHSIPLATSQSNKRSRPSSTTTANTKPANYHKKSEPVPDLVPALMCPALFCSFSAPHHLALAQHERTKHAKATAFLCDLCGYKGYSIRGMKSHLRTHEDFVDKRNIDDQLLEHVRVVPNEKANQVKRQSPNTKTPTDTAVEEDQPTSIKPDTSQSASSQVLSAQQLAELNQVNEQQQHLLEQYQRLSVLQAIGILPSPLLPCTQMQLPTTVALANTPPCTQTTINNKHLNSVSSI